MVSLNNFRLYNTCLYSASKPRPLVVKFRNVDQVATNVYIQMICEVNPSTDLIITHLLSWELAILAVDIRIKLLLIKA